MVVELSVNEFLFFISGWALVAVSVPLLFVIFWMTPAWQFLRAKASRNPIAWIKDRTGRGMFRVGKVKDPGSMDIKKLGYVGMEEGSHVMEMKSKVPVFDVFSEYGQSIPKEYAPIIKELKDAGFEVNNFDDYKRLVDLASNESYQENYLNSFKNEERREQAKQRIEELKKFKVEIKPYKSYSFHQLANMFPNNISPVYVDAKVTNAVLRKAKQMAMKQGALITLAVFLAIIFVAGAIAYKMLPPQNCPNPEVIIRTVETGVRAAVANATASNVVI